MFIQVGYGLEGVIPDITAYDITERHIKPRFRNNDYEGGLATGIELLMKAARGEYKGTGKTVAEKGGGDGAHTPRLLRDVHDSVHPGAHLSLLAPIETATRLSLFGHGRAVYRRLVGAEAVAWWRRRSGGGRIQRL